MKFSFELHTNKKLVLNSDQLTTLLKLIEESEILEDSYTYQKLSSPDSKSFSIKPLSEKELKEINTQPEEI